MKTASEETQRRKVGRPPKEKKGQMVWIPSEYLDMVSAYIQFLKEHRPRTESK
jgi:hypothetical protein